jgi:dolichol-phosphate mannosyltransferase
VGRGEKIAVVLAAYNERENLLLLLPRLRQTLEAMGHPWELVMVVDGEDGTREWLTGLPQEGAPGRVTLSWSPRRRGFGRALREGFRLASPDAALVTTLDCDLNHDPEDLPRFVRALEERGAHVVVGSRYLAGGMVHTLPWWKRWASGLANRLLPTLTGLPLTDLTSNYRLYRREVAEMLAREGKANDFSFAPEALLLAARRGFRVVEVPITFSPRRYGASKLPKLATALGYLRLLALSLRVRAAS